MERLPATAWSDASPSNVVSRGRVIPLPRHRTDEETPMNDAKNDDYVGSGVVALLKEKPWARAIGFGVLAAVAVGIALLLYLNVQGDANGSNAVEGIADPRVLSSACDDPSTNAEVERALAITAESQENALLAFPSEVPADEREAQADAWDSLSADDRAFQLCLHLKQEGVSN